MLEPKQATPTTCSTRLLTKPQLVEHLSLSLSLSLSTNIIYSQKREEEKAKEGAVISAGTCMYVRMYTLSLHITAFLQIATLYHTLLCYQQQCSPQANFKARREGEIWVEPLATSKPLHSSHSHIKEKSVLKACGPTYLVYAGENTEQSGYFLYLYMIHDTILFMCTVHVHVCMCIIILFVVQVISGN